MGYGYMPGPASLNIRKEYAWFPKKTTSGKRLWLKTYYRIFYYKNYEYDIDLKILNEKEFFLWSLENPVRESSLPSKENKLYHYKK